MGTSTTLGDLQTLLGDRYDVVRELGRGGMATVYLATDRKLGREVAVKVLHPDLGVALGADRFRREIDVASRLSHPHILPIDDVGGTGDSLYYVMPFVRGETLYDRIRREGMLPLDQAVRITCQVARALDYAHRQGIIHRDVKPENILLEDGEALLADFGIARAFSESGAERRLTQTGVTLGTPVYMSPEQAVAERELDGRSDVYSLGCVMYEMLAGQPPFVGPTAQAIIARQMLDDVPSLTVVRGAVPDEIEDAVLRALAKVPADRFATAGDFADALEHSMATGGASLGGSERRTRPRKRTGATGAGVPTQPARARRLLFAGTALAALLAAAAGGWRFYEGRSATTAASADGGSLSPRRIAVLYFDDLSNDRSLGPLADGLTEELIRELGAVPGLDVVSRNGVAPFRDGNVPVDSVAETLGAGTIVRGSVEPSGKELHVVVRLIDGSSGADFKRASFNAPATRALAARDSVVDQVARFLRNRVGEEIHLRSTRQAASNEAAWALALQAENLAKAGRALAKSNDTLGARRARLRADSLLARATTLDPAWPSPVVQRGRLALELSRLTKDPVEAARWTDAGLQRAQEALTSDGRNAEALALRGTLRLERWKRHLEPDPRRMDVLLEGATADLKQAVALAPGDANAWGSLAMLHYAKADFIDATLAARRAYETDAYLNNADAILWRLFTTAYDSESFLDAVHWCEEGQRRFPDSPAFVKCQLLLLTTNVRPPDPTAAWTLVDALRKRTPEHQWPYQGREAQIFVAAAIGKAGLKDSANRVLERARAGPDIDSERELLSLEAFVRELLGERDAALGLLKEYLTLRPEHRSGLAASRGWWWRNLRSDPRYRALVGITD